MHALLRLSRDPGYLEGNNLRCVPEHTLTLTLACRGVSYARSRWLIGASAFITSKRAASPGIPVRPITDPREYAGPDTLGSYVTNLQGRNEIPIVGWQL
jgi:hypothetical protein